MAHSKRRNYYDYGGIKLKQSYLKGFIKSSIKNGDMYLAESAIRNAVQLALGQPYTPNTDYYVNVENNTIVIGFELIGDGWNTEQEVSKVYPEFESMIIPVSQVIRELGLTIYAVTLEYDNLEITVDYDYPQDEV